MSGRRPERVRPRFSVGNFRRRPIPFDSEKNEVEEIIFAYLLDRFLHRRPKPQQTFNSARAHARDLVDFDQFLAEVDLDWFDVQPRDIEEYVQTLANTSSPATSREYAEGTIDRREYSIRRFYQWAFQEGLVTDPQFGKAYVPTRKQPLNDQFLPHTGAYTLTYAARMVGRGAGRPPEDPAPLQLEEWQQLAARLGPLPSERINAGGSADRLIAECGLQISNRLFETCFMDVKSNDGKQREVNLVGHAPSWNERLRPELRRSL